MKKRFVRAILMTVLLLSVELLSAQDTNIPEAFAYIQTEIKDVVLDIRYCGNHNFIGRPIDGYTSPRPVVTKETLVALVAVQQELKKNGLGLKIFDAYRPQRAVDHFVRWSYELNDTLMKQAFYPNLRKDQLFELGYIAYKSGHSRGSTVDITLVSLRTGEEVDMGSPYDFFGEISWPFAKGISKKQQENRLLLRRVMLANGFKPYANEWWHFTLNNEPFPNTYFDFVVE